MNPFTDPAWNDPVPNDPTYRSLPRVQVNPVSDEPPEQSNPPQQQAAWQQLPPPENTRDLLLCKLFYFCFYASFGSLFPLMGVYFKQLGMSPLQTGWLIGVRPFIELFSAPFWIHLANRHDKTKQMLVGSLCCWLVFTGALAFIRPPAAACVFRNESSLLLYPAYLADGMSTSLSNEPESTQSTNSKRDEQLAEAGAALALPFKSGMSHWSRVVPTKPPPTAPQLSAAVPAQVEQSTFDSSPLRIDSISVSQNTRARYVWPPHTRLVYRADEVDEVFVLLLLLVLLGEFFAAPAVPLADTATVTLLAQQPDLYGRQRMFGSAGWALAMLLVGFALDRSTHFPAHPCIASSAERNYRICFQTFAVLMCAACFFAGRLRMVSKERKCSPQVGAQILLQLRAAGIRPETIPRTNVIQADRNPHLLDRWRSAVFAQRNCRLPNWLSALRNASFAALLLLATFMGFGVGLVFTFLFWHLQDLGGSPTLFGLASVVNHLSEIGAYFHTLRYIRRFGRLKVLGFALLCNFLRFLCIACIQEAWHILPLELLQGITHAAVWATLCSLLEDAAPQETPEAAQAWLHAAYSALGKGGGSLLGGLLIRCWGARLVFGLYALASLLVLCILLLISTRLQQRLPPDLMTKSSATTQNGFPMNTNGNTMCPDTEFNRSPALCGLTPHGVPTAPIGTLLNQSTPESELPPPLTEAQLAYQRQQQLLQQSDEIAERLIAGNLREWKPEIRAYRKANS